MRFFVVTMIEIKPQGRQRNNIHCAGTTSVIAAKMDDDNATIKFLLINRVYSMLACSCNKWNVYDITNNVSDGNTFNSSYCVLNTLDLSMISAMLRFFSNMLQICKYVMKVNTS